METFKVGDKVRVNAGYLAKYPSEKVNGVATKPSRLTGKVGTILRDLYGDGERFEIDFGVPVNSKRHGIQETTWILGSWDLEAK